MSTILRADWRWTQYPFTDLATRTRLQHTAVISGQSKNYIVNQRYTCDNGWRLKNTYHKIGDGPTEVLLSENTYNERDDLSKKRLASNQDVDYLYNIRKWLTDINNAASCSSPDLFSMKIKYESGNTDLNVPGNWNGVISSMEWRVGANCTVNGQTRNKAAYGFTYDAQNRLTKGVYGEYNSSNNWISAAFNNYTVDPIAYDDNGNITGITRRGYISGMPYNTIDNLTYTYSATYGNHLASISETSDATRGFKTLGGAGYTYDNNGNLTADSYKGITAITYNYLNLPAKVTYSATKYIEFTYDANGVKWKKKTVDGAVTTEKYYFGPIEYNGSNVEAIYHEEGRAAYISSNFEYQYAIRDHLGNTRVMFTVSGGAATIIQENHYYPFGMEMQGGSFVGGMNLYLFNGIERENALGMNMDMALFRSYDPTVGKWWQLDPLAEVAPDWSPYRFGFDNPVLNKDPVGLFETRDEARQYKRDNDLRGTVRRQSDGTYAIENRKEHSFITKDTDLGILTGVLVEARGVHLREIGLDGFSELNNPFSESYNPNAVVITDGLDIAYVFGVYLGFASPTAKIPIAGRSATTAAEATSEGGRLGNASTRKHILEIATELEKRGYTITGGGGRRAEEYLRPAGGGRKGGSYVDITATHPRYGTIRINTVDVLKDGVTPTARELGNATRIRSQIPNGEHLILIPKK